MKTLVALVLFFGIALSIPAPRNPNPDLFEGDMIITPAQREWLFSDSTSRNGMRDPNLRWPNAVVYYRMDRNLTRNERNLVVSSLKKVSDVTCLTFRQGSNSKGHYIRVTNNPDDGCWSYVGYLAQVQQLNIGDGCVYEDTIIHEFLHAVGFQHQQSSYERDNYVEIHLENVEKGQEHNFDKYTRKEVTNFGTRYDYDSIMHYDGLAFSKNGKPTMIAKVMPDGKNMGKATKMSATDVYKINAMYQCQ